MCGIHVSISTQSFLAASHELKQLLYNRGPDHTGEAVVEIDKHGVPYYLSFTSTVLALRGGDVTPQPFVDRNSGSVLCWNGEAWKIGSDVVDGNDGQDVFDILLHAVSAQDSPSKSIAAVHDVLKSISGPFAFVFLDRIHKQIFFGRDRLGRRSLLYSTNSKSMEFSSTADPSRGTWKEVEADAIYILSPEHRTLENETQHPDDPLRSSPILSLQKRGWGSDKSLSVPSLGVFNRTVPVSIHRLTFGAASVNKLRQCLYESLKLRILNIPVPPGSSNAYNTRLAILFSGGLDCTVLARMAHDLLPSEYQIDLLNVAFENPRVTQAAKNSPSSKKSLTKTSEDAKSEEEHRSPARDEGMISDSSFESCPDRDTGRKSFQELKTVCPTRVWRFVAINIPYTETLAHRAKVVSLIQPHNTEMDLSIACALYFASRGTGIASSGIEQDSKYTTPARVLLSGLGADELFGGYTRHATAFNRRGYTALLDEMELDVNRLGKRNLGRDDRVIAHWGREARFPYLDESLVKWAVECPIWGKCGFQTGPLTDEDNHIEPGKKVLRLLAYELGMRSVAHEKKRAIQFGARTAKMEVGRTKGTSLIT